MCYKVKWLNKNQHLKDIFVERTLHFFFLIYVWKCILCIKVKTIPGNEYRFYLRFYVFALKFHYYNFMNDIKCVKIKNRRNNLESNIEHSFALQFRPIFHFIKWTKNRKNKWNHFRTTFGPIFQIHIHKRTRCQQYWDLLSLCCPPSWHRLHWFGHTC